MFFIGTIIGIGAGWYLRGAYDKFNEQKDADDQWLDEQPNEPPSAAQPGGDDKDDH